MTRTRTLAPILGLTAFSAAALFSPAPARAQTITVTDLSPARYNSSDANGVSGSKQVGDGYVTSTDGNSEVSHALLWTGTAASVVDLHPSGFGPYPTPFDYSLALGVSGNTQVGVFYSDYGTHYAVLWHGTADSIVGLDNDYSDINTGSAAVAASGDAQVGYVSSQFSDDEPVDYTAVLWHGTADSAVELGAGVYKLYNTLATGVSGDTQVGYGFNYDEGFVNALLWHGTSDSVVDLNPAGYDASYAYGASGDTQVGNAFLNNSQHAALWRGTAASFVDLNPKGDSESVATGAADGAQVGYAVVGRDAGTVQRHAMLWRGTAFSALDLNAFLPSAQGVSEASGVTGSGGVYDVVGSSGGRAILWHVVFTPPALSSLVPASRTEGRGDFPLTVLGKGFDRKSVIKWNGAAQHTIYVSPTQLAVSIPAALIAHAGTAQVTVSNGVVTSNSRTETINPRPVLNSLSPATKKRSDNPFTLTVNGTGFLPQSRVKVDGAEMTTTYVSSTKLTSVVPYSISADRGSYSVTVTTPQVATSAPLTLTITP